MNQLSQLGNLNQHQLDILKLFSRQLDESDMLEIKRLIVAYLSSKLTELADDVWDQNGWSSDDMERMLSAHERTPYNSKN